MRKLDAGLIIGNWYHTVLWYTGQYNYFALTTVLDSQVIETTWSVFPSAEFRGIRIVILMSRKYFFLSQNVNICFIISECAWILTFGGSQRPNFILKFWILDKEKHFILIVTRLDLPWGQLTHCEQFIASWMKWYFGPVDKSADNTKCDQ